MDPSAPFVPADFVPPSGLVTEGFVLEPGDVLVLYTDGLIEARNAMNEEFGLERVEQILCSRANAPVRDIHDSLLAAVKAWTPVQQDDITMIVLRRQPQGAHWAPQS